MGIEEFKKAADYALEKSRFLNSLISQDKGIYAIAANIVDEILTPIRRDDVVPGDKEEAMRILDAYSSNIFGNGARSYREEFDLRFQRRFRISLREHMNGTGNMTEEQKAKLLAFLNSEDGEKTIAAITTVACEYSIRATMGKLYFEDFLMQQRN